MSENNEGLTVESTRMDQDAGILNPKPKRKSPERYGPVTSLDLERLREDVPHGVWANQLERLILRAKIAEANAKKEKKAKSG